MRALIFSLAALFALAPVILDARAQQVAPLPQLVDIAAKAGIHFEHLSTPDKRYIVESMSGGVALIDYDGDGYPDLYFTNAPDVSQYLAGTRARSELYHNNHDGTFTEVTDKAGVGYPCWAMGAVVGDYNNDGHPDLLVSCFGGIVLYRNNGDGTFTDVTKQAGLGGDAGWATGASFGDADGDGWPDLFVPHYVALDLHDLPALGSQKNCLFHAIPVQCGPRGLQGTADNLYRNNHDGTFTDISKQAGVSDPQHYFGLSSVWAHFGDDSKLDLFVTDDSEPNYLYRNDGSGHFTEVGYQSGTALNKDGAEQANMGIALGDYDHSGRLSIAVTHFSEEYTTLFHNDGGLSFTDVSFEAGLGALTAPYVGWGDAFFDFDNDGWLDFFQLNGHVYPQVDTKDIGTRFREPKLLFLNLHDGRFREISHDVGQALALPQVSRGLAVGDLFNNGRLDLVIENLEGHPMILEPRGDAHNHWVEFALTGPAGNRLALNARVRVQSGTLRQVDEVRSGGSYLSQSDLRLHFGLGEHAEVDQVQILWPDGRTESFSHLAADRIYPFHEGSNAVSPGQSAPQSNGSQPGNAGSR